jgi:hypothetical protein
VPCRYGQSQEPVFPPSQTPPSRHLGVLPQALRIYVQSVQSCLAGLHREKGSNLIACPITAIINLYFFKKKFDLKVRFFGFPKVKNILEKMVLAHIVIHSLECSWRLSDALSVFSETVAL